MAVSTALVVQVAPPRLGLAETGVVGHQQALAVLKMLPELVLTMVLAEEATYLLVLAVGPGQLGE